MDQDNRRSPETHGDRNPPVPDYPVVQTVQKEKINEIYTAARWDAVDILSFFKSIGFDRSNFINLRKELDS